MHNHVAEKIKGGSGTRVHALMVDGGLRRLVCLGDFDTIRYHFNQMACLTGGVAMEELLATTGASPPGCPVRGVWADRMTRTPVGGPAHVYALAASGPSPESDLIGAMAWFNDWPNGMDTIKGTKHLCTSMSEIGGLFYASGDTHIVRAGRAQERSAVKRVEEAILDVKLKGYTVADEAGLRLFMKRYAEAKYLQLIHAVDVD